MGVCGCLPSVAVWGVGVRNRFKARSKAQRGVADIAVHSATDKGGDVRIVSPAVVD